MVRVDLWYHDLPQRLLETAYRVGAEMAWRRSDTMEVIALLHAAGRKVIGVDIWLATRDGPTIPTPYVYDWEVDRLSDDPLYQGSAEHFVCQFNWHPDDKIHTGVEPWFNIVVSDNQGRLS